MKSHELDALGRSAAARELLQEAHSILLESFGEEDARTARARDALAGIRGA